MKRLNFLILILIISSFFITINKIQAQFIACPSSTDLGTYNCTNIQNIPQPANSVAEATNPPYNINLSGAPTNTRVTTMDDNIIFYCTDNARLVNRTIIIYIDNNFSFAYELGEEVGQCVFQINTVPDTTPPSFTRPFDAIASCSIGYDPDQTGYVTNLNDGTCPINIQEHVYYADAIADGLCLGELIVTRSWVAVDPCGNTSATQTQSIYVEDNEGPIFNLPPDIVIPCSSDPTDESLTGTVTDAMEECDPSPIAVSGTIVTDLTQEDTPCSGSTTYIKKLEAVDDCNNPTIKYQTIVVECPPSCSNADICQGDIVTAPLPGECDCQIVEEQVLGCTDQTALNYNPNANCDNDSCTIDPNATNVWPGDLNHDGVVNNQDNAIFDLQIGNSGTPRQELGIIWKPYLSPDWGVQIPAAKMADLKHFDCDGNGAINSQDYNAILLNWGKPPHNEANNTAPGIYPFGSFTSNTKIYLKPVGDVTNNLLIMDIVLEHKDGINIEMFGGFFTILYLNQEVSSANVVFSSSWLGSPNGNLNMDFKDFPSQQKVEVGFSRTNGTNATGSGIIGQVTFSINGNFKRGNNSEILNFNAITIGAHNNVGEPIAISDQHKSINVGTADCESWLNINQSTPFQNLYQSNGIIQTADNLIIGENQQVAYNASNRVTLNTGFSARVGADFKVRNSGCN